MIFSDVERLRRIANETGRMQFIFAGKSHPRDWPGKELIKKVYTISHQLRDEVDIVYLVDYDMGLVKLITSGVDLWLNTPQKSMGPLGRPV